MGAFLFFIDGSCFFHMMIVIVCWLILEAFLQKFKVDFFIFFKFIEEMLLNIHLFKSCYGLSLIYFICPMLHYSVPFLVSFRSVGSICLTQDFLLLIQLILSFFAVFRFPFIYFRYDVCNFYIKFDITFSTIMCCCFQLFMTNMNFIIVLR